MDEDDVAAAVGVARTRGAVERREVGERRGGRAVATRRGGAVDLGCGKSVEMRQKVGTSSPLRRYHRRQRHHLILVIARIQPRQVLRILAVRRIRLDHDPPHVAELVELADRERAELRLDRAVHILYRHPEQGGFVAVHDGAQLLGVGGVGRCEAGELGTLSGGFEEILHDSVERGGISVPRVLDPEFESAGRADARNGRGRDRDDHCSLDQLCFLVERLEYCSRVLGLRGLERLVAFVEVLERYEEGPGIALETAVEQAISGDHRAGLDARELGKDRVDLISDRLRTIDARRLRHDDRRHCIALVLVGHEAGGQDMEHVPDRVQEYDQKHQRRHGACDHPLDRMPEASGYGVHLAVEPRK